MTTGTAADDEILMTTGTAADDEAADAIADYTGEKKCGAALGGDWFASK